ncbi:hypothetical protein B5E82_13285 [Lachnoclostridium sp. An138]|nr:hypothetical protein B5E82_13285 [Lachnoclostridium sp. An138]
MNRLPLVFEISICLFYHRYANVQAVQENRNGKLEWRNTIAGIAGIWYTVDKTKAPGNLRKIYMKSTENLQEICGTNQRSRICRRDYR